MRFLLVVFEIAFVLFLVMVIAHDSIWLIKFPYRVGDEVNLHMEDDDYLGKIKAFDSDSNRIFIEFGEPTLEWKGKVYKNKAYRVVEMNLQEFRERVF